jgi:hypothetical protein
VAKIVHKLYLHRDKERNYELAKQAEILGWANSDEVLYSGSEISVDVEITNDSEIKTKVLVINGVDVSDKNIYI